jgi:DNA helicase II / ATP-dependent DNA helicase PcrA
LVVTPADVADPGGAVAVAQRAAEARQALIVEIDDRTAELLGQPQHTHEAVHRLGPRFTFEVERLHALTFGNAVDHRHAACRFDLLDDAIALGATVVLDAGGGDVILPDGRRAWLDGGLLRHSPPIDGVGVLHRVAVEHASLDPFPELGDEFEGELAPDQRAAVRHGGGAARIVAPAGSGKTRVLTERARHLLRDWRLPPAAVCLVAFNKRAQEEIRRRTADLPGLQVRTLNAIALAIVNGSAPFAARPQRRETIDEPAVRTLIGRLVDFPRRRNADPVAGWIDALSTARLGLRDPRAVERMYDGDVDGFAEMLPRYRAELARRHQLDFDEQVLAAIELLLTEPAVRSAAQRACRVLLVDEFQDLTPAHVLLVRLLAGPDLAVFAVGDDDQTIYGYNGADPAFLIDFAELFPGAGDHPLEVNYRCPAGVVTAVDRLLRNNVRRVDKTLRAASDDPGGWQVISTDHPVATTVDTVGQAVAGGLRPGEVAVLTRVNSLLAPVQIALEDAGVPCASGVGPEFAERTAVRAALAWLRLAGASDDGRFAPTDLAEALRRPSRPLHPNVARWLTEQTSVGELRRLAARLTNERDATRVDEFATDIARLQGLVRAARPTAEVLATLRDSLGLAGSIATLDTHRVGTNRAAQHDDLVAVVQLAELHPDPTTFESWLRSSLARRRSADGVTLATVHRVKGQEWPLVVVHLADSDQFPHRLAEDVEEERRLFHVALTRARRQVVVVVDDTPSPFIDELEREPGPRPVPGSAGRAARPAARSSAAPPPQRPGHDLSVPDATLFAALRDLRRHLADGKPAFTVLADSALHDISTQRPRTLAELAGVRGVGPNKLDRYGSAILAVVEDHTAPNVADDDASGVEDGSA